MAKGLTYQCTWLKVLKWHTLYSDPNLDNSHFSKLKNFVKTQFWQDKIEGLVPQKMGKIRNSRFQIGSNQIWTVLEVKQSLKLKFETLKIGKIAESTFSFRAKLELEHFQHSKIHHNWICELSETMKKGSQLHNMLHIFGK